MKIAYFDCEFGAAGDMLNGALLDAGASLEHLTSELAKLGLPGQAFELGLESVIRCTYTCKKFNVVTGPDKNYETGLFPASSSSSSEHEPPGLAFQTAKFAPVSGVSTSERSAVKAKTEICSGTLSGLLTLLSKSGLTAPVKELAGKIFETIYAAEAVCRGLSVDKLDMNQMALLDAIVDVVGFSINYHALGIERAYVSAVPLGSGTFEYAGELNLGAAPATVQVLKDAGARISGRPFGNECLTVTGAAILATVSSGWSRPAFTKITDTGYGAGSYDPSSYPNACRVLIGPDDDPHGAAHAAQPEGRFQAESILVLEANIDDLAPQSLAYATEKLLAAGALDVLVLPAVMKKGRSGHLLKVLANLEDRQLMQEIMFSETSTIGVRSYSAERALADRTWHDVIMDDGTSIRVKTASDKAGSMIHSQPEYEDCAAYATKHNIPLKEVIAQALARFRADKVRS